MMTLYLAMQTVRCSTVQQNTLNESAFVHIQNKHENIKTYASKKQQKAKILYNAYTAFRVCSQTHAHSYYPRMIQTVLTKNGVPSEITYHENVTAADQ